MLALASGYRWITKPAFVGPAISNEQAANSAFVSSDLGLIKSHALLRPFVDPFAIPLRGFPAWIIWLNWGVCALGLGLLLRRVVRKPDYALDVCCRLLPAGVLAYLIALYFSLYYADRQPIVLPILFFICVSIGWSNLIERVKWKWLPHFLFGLFFIGQISSVLIPDKRRLYAPTPMPLSLAAFIRQFPKDVLIVAPRELAGEIPLLCRRKVFFDPNVYNAVEYPKFLEWVRTRETLNDQWTHSDDLQGLDTMHQVYGVNYLILHRAFKREPFQGTSPWLPHLNKAVPPQRAIKFFSDVQRSRLLWVFDNFVLIDLNSKPNVRGILDKR